MTTPVYTDNFGIKYYNRRVGCFTVGCINEGVEIMVLASAESGSEIICGPCCGKMEPLAAGVVISPPEIEHPEAEEELPVEDEVIDG